MKSQQDWDASVYASVCVCVCSDLVVLPLTVSGNSVTDSSGNEKVSQEKFAPCILTPPPHFLF